MEWLYALIGTAFLALIAVVWNMLNDKIKVIRDECEERDTRIWDQLGRDGDHGMRHKVHNAVPMGAHIELEARVDRMERGK